MRISDPDAVGRVLKALADPENTAMMVRLRTTSKSAQGLSAETGIPASTVYRKLEDLRAAGLVVADHSEVTGGKKIDFVTVSFTRLSVILEEGRTVIELTPSTEAANILWLRLVRGG